MAQEVEHVLGKDEVAGSNPAISSKENHQIWWFFHYICTIYCVSEKIREVPTEYLQTNCRRFLAKKKARDEVDLIPNRRLPKSLRNALILSALQTFADVCIFIAGRVLPFFVRYISGSDFLRIFAGLSKSDKKAARSVMPCSSI